MKLETVELNKLKPSEYNPRTITEEEFNGLKESLLTFGQQENLIVNKDFTIISGHQRYEAMKALGWTEAVCNVVDLDKHAEKKLNVIMNSTAISGKYDDLKLAEILEDLKLDDDYEALRLDKLEPLDLSDIEVEEDEAPEVSSEPPVSKLGEVYQLGRHRVMCGDSTDKASVELLMTGEKAGMVFTDPPYALFGNSTGVSEGVADDKMVRPFFREAMKIMQKFTKQYGHIYMCCDWHSAFSIEAISREIDLRRKNMCIWYKGQGGIGAMYTMSYEIVWFFANSPINKTTSRTIKGGKERTVNGVSNVWEVKRETGEKYHNALKPIEMIQIPINASSDDGDIVLDLFLGSGSTLIACEQTDRTCYGMELDPKYCDVIRKRYWKFVNDGNEEGWEDGTKAI